jgi:hypothetical protein
MARAKCCNMGFHFADSCIKYNGKLIASDKCLITAGCHAVSLSLCAFSG